MQSAQKTPSEYIRRRNKLEATPGVEPGYEVLQTSA